MMNDAQIEESKGQPSNDEESSNDLKAVPGFTKGNLQIPSLPGGMKKFKSDPPKRQLKKKLSVKHLVNDET